MNTIKINGHEFSVTTREGKSRRYALRQIGGQLTYLTMRDAHHPHLMWLLDPSASGDRGVTDIWLSDEGGTLRQIYGAP